MKKIRLLTLLIPLMLAGCTARSANTTTNPGSNPGINDNNPGEEEPGENPGEEEPGENPGGQEPGENPGGEEPEEVHEVGDDVERENIIPAFNTKNCTNNRKVTNTVLKGKITLINYWATWCGPCKQELPYLQQLSTKYADNDFQIIGICSDTATSNGAIDSEAVAACKALYSQYGLTYQSVFPVAAFNKLAGMSGYIPMSIMVNGNGDKLDELQVGSKNLAGWDSYISGVLKKYGKL